MMTDPYFDLPQVSNSDLTALKHHLTGVDFNPPEEAFAFGSLVDAMITEPDRIDWFRKTLNGQPVEDFDRAKACFRAFNKHHLAPAFIKGAEFQKVSIKERLFEWEGLEFWLNCRCKWDFFGHISGDIKTTTATTQKQFESACDYFDYFRQRAWYMDLENTDRDVLIGISKVNYKVFIIKIERNDENYLKGKAQYTDLAMKYWALMN